MQTYRRLRPRRSAYALLDEVCAAENLISAWDKVRATHGAAGVDHVSIAAFEQHWRANLAQLERELREQTYRPRPTLALTIEKPDGSARHLGVLTVRDRVAQRAVYAVIAPLFERLFLDCSYAYRPGRSTAQAVAAVLRARRRGYVWAVDADIDAFFDTLDQRILLRRVGLVVRDAAILRLIRLWLEAGALKASAPVPAHGIGMTRVGRADDERAGHWPRPRAGGARVRMPVAPRLHGTVQGAVLSPLLANAYLHPVDAALSRRRPHVIRYADDLLILCRTREEAAEALHDLRVALACVGLRLAEEKTSIHHVDTPFRFLGYRIAAGRATAAPARLIVTREGRRGEGMARRRVPRGAVPRRGVNGGGRSGYRRQGEDVVRGRAGARRHPWHDDRDGGAGREGGGDRG